MLFGSGLGSLDATTIHCEWTQCKVDKLKLQLKREEWCSALPFENKGKVEVDKGVEVLTLKNCGVEARQNMFK